MIAGLSQRPSERLWHRHASPLSLVLLGAIVLAALLGFAGGTPAPVRTARFAAATLTVKAPALIRNGEFVETRIVVEANTAIAQPVIGVDAAYWRDITVNTMMPAPADEAFAGGMFRFNYGALEPGDKLEIKIDGQINPSLFQGTRGRVALFDGDRLIGSQRLELRVLP